jgi:hypothetical protein
VLASAAMMRKAIVVLLVAASSFALAGDKSAPDLDGTPDLIVRTEMLAAQWVVRTEKLAASFCSVIEGDVQPGDRTLVRFTVGTANIGTADVFIGNPQDHVDANDGLFELSTCHQHYHFRHYALYELVDPATGRVWKAAKRGFCMLDTDPNPAYLGEPPHAHYYRSCGSTTFAGNQGISVGWTDTYRFYLGGQYFVLDGGDGQPVVPPGRYVIRITVNPPFAAQAGEACPHRDARGLCHQLPESNYDNNIGEVTIDIPAHPGRTGVGPASNSSPQNEPNDCGG